MESTAAFSLYYQNLGGINTCIAKYKLACSDAAYDFYAFTETWFKSDTLSCLLFDNSYTVYRKDRDKLTSPKETGGGVLLAVRKEFESHLLHPPNTSAIELVWVAVHLTSKTVYICVVYIPADRSKDESLFEQYLSSLSWVVSRMKTNDSLCILGDFNQSQLRWSPALSGHFFVDSNNSTVAPLAARLLDEQHMADLLQINGVTNENNSILDLCLISSDMVGRSKICRAPEPLVKEVRYHPPLHLCIDDCQPLEFSDVNAKTYYDYKNADFQRINIFFNTINWDATISSSDVHSAALKLSHVVLYAVDQFVPKKTHIPPATPEWSTPALKKLKSSKRAALKKFSKCPISVNRLNLNQISNDYRRLNKSLFLAHQSRVQNRL